MRVDVDVTEDNPHRLLTKKEIWDDIEARGVISDFYPAREKIKVCSLIW